MHKPTLAAGAFITLLGIILAINAVTIIQTYCYDEIGFDLCLFGYSGFHFLLSGLVSAVFVSGIGIWLILLGLKSISAKSVMTKTPFVIGFLAAGIILLLVSMMSVFLMQFDQEVAFSYNNYVFEYAQTLIPAGINSFLLGLAGLFMYYVKSPARLLMWILVFVTMVTISSLAAPDSPIGLIIGITAFVAAYWFLQKQIASARNVVVAAVIFGSIGILAIVAYAPPVFFDYGYAEIKPEVTVARNQVVDNIEGISLTRVDNASRVLSPDCLKNDPQCRERYGEGLAELEMYHATAPDGQQIVSGVITNTGTGIINVTDFGIDGSSQDAYTQLVAYGVESSGGISFGGPPFFFFGYSQDQSDAPFTEPVALKPGESLSMYIKGSWGADTGGPITAFNSFAMYNYYVEPLIWYTPEPEDGNACTPGCDTSPIIISNPRFWSLNAYYDSERNFNGSHIARNPAISYAGCMSEQVAMQLLEERKLEAKFPSYIPEGFSSICIIDVDPQSLVQILANDAAMDKEDIRQDPRLLDDASKSPDAGVIKISTQLTPWQNFNQTAFEEYLYNIENIDPDAGKTSFQVIKGNSVAIQENDWGTLVDVSMNGKKYYISGMVSALELLEIAESLM